MIVIVGAIVGFLAGRLIWLALKPSWQRKALLRQNYSGSTLPTAAGIVLLIALVVVEGGRAVVGAVGLGDDPIVTAPRAAALVLVCGFCFLGLLDDLAGREDVRGLNGHVRSMLRGELTSGTVKMIGGLGLSLVAAALVTNGSGGFTLIVDALVIALAANLANLFDLRPGRMTKISLIAFVVLVIASRLDASLVSVAVVMGAAAALILDDLRERLMMGDTGANTIGAVLGLGVITQTGSSGSLIALVILLALNGLSEFVSFSKVIDTFPPFRAFDMLGRRSPQAVDVRGDAEGFDGPSNPRMSSNYGNVGGASDSNIEPNATQRIDVREPSPVRRSTRPFGSTSLEDHEFPDERGERW